MLSGMSTLKDLSKIEDPAERAKQAHGFVLRGREALEEARRLRDAAITEWRKTGATQRQIATELQVTPGLIGQIDSAAKDGQ